VLEDAMRRRRSLTLAALALVVVAVVAAIGVLGVGGRPVVRWSEVLDALAQKETLRGQGRVYSADGPDWDYALWGKVGEGGSCTSKGMLRAMELPGGRNADGPGPEVVVLCQAMDYCGENGIVARLATDRSASGPARREKWRGREVLAAEVDSREVLGTEGAGIPESWRLLLDPATHLLLGMELYVTRGGERMVGATCEYEYDVPLPPGFEDAQGPVEHQSEER
jgi:hypothetical protein